MFNVHFTHVANPHKRPHCARQCASTEWNVCVCVYFLHTIVVAMRIRWNYVGSLAFLLIIITIANVKGSHCSELGRNKLSSPIHIIRWVQVCQVTWIKFLHRVNMFALPFAAIARSIITYMGLLVNHDDDDRFRIDTLHMNFSFVCIRSSTRLFVRDEFMLAILLMLLFMFNGFVSPAQYDRAFDRWIFYLYSFHRDSIKICTNLSAKNQSNTEHKIFQMKMLTLTRSI